MNKNILLVCEHPQLDLPLQRSLAHLAKCCEITHVYEGHQFFEQLSTAVFDLIIINFEIGDYDGLELVESVQYIDPGVPVILMVDESQKAIWQAALRLKAQPIIRPFKPLSFLRLVDKLLHQHLNYYRQLTATLKTVLAALANQTSAQCAVLLDESGEVILITGEIPGVSPAQLGERLAESFIKKILPKEGEANASLPEGIEKEQWSVGVARSHLDKFDCQEMFGFSKEEILGFLDDVESHIEDQQ